MRPTRRCGAASGCGRRSAGGVTARSAPRSPTRPRWCGRPRPSSFCTRARWSTTTTWTPPTPAAVDPRPHAMFGARHRGLGWSGSPEQYGAAAAILLGDLLLSWSDELLRCSGLPDDRVREALGIYDLTRSEVIAGQFLDVSVQARGESDVELAMKVLRYKSAKYSIERPLHVGADLGRRRRRRPGGAVGVRPPPRRGLPAARRPARRVRRSGCSPASRPGTT